MTRHNPPIASDRAKRVFQYRVLGGATIIVAMVFSSYHPSINGGFIWDDNLLFVNNVVIHAPDGLYRIWCTTESPDYWPVTNTSFWIEWRLWGMNPTGYHVTNMILHSVEALLIWVVLQKLSIPGAFFAALIFAVHPVNVESVAWIAQRKNLMSMLFFLLSILIYINFLTHARVPLAAKHPLAPSPSFLAPALWYWFSLSTFILAMLSKGSVVMLPVLLLGIVWWDRRLTWRHILRTVPFFVVAVIFTIVNMWFQKHGTDVVIREADFVERLLGAGCVVWFYLYKALLPINLVFVYPQWSIEADNPLWWFPLAAALIVTAVLWMYRNNWSRPWLFAWGVFCVALVPVMGFTDVFFLRYSPVADHYQNIAIVGVVALVSAGFSAWHQRPVGTTLVGVTVKLSPQQITKELSPQQIWHQRSRQLAAIALYIAAVGILAFLTWRQSGLYRDAITIYKNTLEKNPGCWLAHNNLGVILGDTGRLQEAIEHCTQAKLLKPDYPEAYNNLGMFLAQAGRPGKAIEQYGQALRINPNSPEVHNNLGTALAKTGQPQEAIKHFQLALKFRPDYAEALNNLGLALSNAGRSQEAIEPFQQALNLNPDYPEALNNLGNTLLAIGRKQDAIDHIQKALALKSDYAEARNNLGMALLQSGRPRDAIEQFQQVLRLRPELTAVYYNMALAYADMNRPAEAIAAAEKARDSVQAQGQTELAGQIEKWLKSYRAGLGN